MKKITPLILLLCLLFQQVQAQNKENSFVVMSYNVENLFDTFDDPVTNDDDFTPEGVKKWTSERYKEKLAMLTQAILAIPTDEMPAIIGLAEVENRTVLEDLVSTRKLRKGKYEIIHEDGMDPRGIDCAILYRPELFTYKSHVYIPIEDPSNPDYLYRGILYVQGKAVDGSNLHIFMNHWKSRSGGSAETERQRMITAITLRKQLDILLAKGNDQKLIVMGDFNDEPTNTSIISGLSASGKRKNITLGDRYNLYYDKHNLENLGTYNYKGQWNMLDQIIVSYNLLNQAKGLSTTFDGGKILKEEWMLYQSEKYGEMLPSSTYGGPEYFGGPADHLPIYVVFTY